MQYYPDSFLQDLKDKSPIEDIVSQYVDMKRAGGNFLGLCPFHREKTPSFTVSAQKQIFHCFGCNTGGNVFNFIMRIENIDFVEAVALLAKKAGMELPTADKAADALYEKRKSMIHMHRDAARFFYKSLCAKDGEEALNYLHGRQISNETIKKFGLGFAPNSWNALVSHLTGLGYSKGDIEEAGLGIRGKTGDVYDRFRNRVIFPIIDIRSQVIGFGGRVMGDEMPKYLNSPETAVFSKGRNLFSMNFAKATAQKDGIILAEGYMDVISLYQAGFTNAVASLGTALTQEQARQIARYTKQVTIAYDSDAPGQVAAKKAIDILKRAEIEVKVLTITGGKDPDAYIKSYGADRFRLLLQGSNSDIDYKMESLAVEYDLGDIMQKTKFLSKMVELLCTITSAIERELYIKKIAGQYQISSAAIESEVSKAIKKRNKSMQQENKTAAISRLLPDVSRGQEEQGVTKARKNEQTLLALLYENPSCYELVKDMQAEDFLGEAERNAFAWIVQEIKENRMPDITFAQEQLSGAEISVLTRAISAGEEIQNKERAIRELADEMKQYRLKKEAINANSEDMREMVRWYNQIKNKKNK